MRTILFSIFAVGLFARPAQDIGYLDRRVTSVEQRLYSIESQLRSLQQQAMSSRSGPATGAPGIGGGRDLEIDRLRSILRHARIPRESAAEFWERVLDLSREFSATPRGGDTVYGFVAGLYPTDFPALPDASDDEM